MAYQRDARYSLTAAAFKHTLLIDNQHIREPAAAAAAAAEASIVGMRRAFNLPNVWAKNLPFAANIRQTFVNTDIIVLLNSKTHDKTTQIVLWTRGLNR